MLWDYLPSKRTEAPHLSHQLCVDLGDPVDGARPLDAQVWRGVARRGGPEGTDGAGDKEAQAMFCCNVQNVVKT